MNLEDYLNQLVDNNAELEAGLKQIEDIKKANEKFSSCDFSARNKLYLNIYSHDERRTISKEYKVSSIDDIMKHIPSFEIDDTQSMRTNTKTPYRVVVGNLNDLNFYAGSVGQRYTHLEHKDVLENTFSFFEKNNLEVDRVYVNNNTVRIQAVNIENKINDVRGMPIYSGVNVDNSVGGCGSYSVGIYTMQQWCKNGCSHNLGSVTAKFKHTNDLIDNQKVSDTIKKASEGTNVVFELLKDMQKTEITREYWNEIKPYVCFDKRTILGIDAMYETGKVIAFDAWRTLTQKIESKISNNKIKSLSTMDKYRNDIENMLFGNKTYFISKSSLNLENPLEIKRTVSMK